MVTAAADGFVGAVEHLVDVRDAVTGRGHALMSEWTGQAAMLAAGSIRGDADRVSAVADVCDRAAPVMRTFAEELRLAQQDHAHGEALALDGQATIAGAGSGAAVAADAARLRGQAGVDDGSAVMLAAEDRARLANETAARRIEQLADELARVVAADRPRSPPTPPPADGGSVWTGLRKAAGDVTDEVTSLISGALDHVNVFSDDVGSTWSDTWKTATTAVTNPVQAVTEMARGTVEPVVDSYRSGGLDEAIGRAPAVLASVVGGKGLTKLSKLDGVDELPTGSGSSLAPGGGLQAHDNAGGHTLAPGKVHVGAGDRQLIDRQAGRKRAIATSSYTDRASAERAASENLRGNREQIKRWLAGPDDRTRFVWDHGYTVGRQAPKGATEPFEVVNVSRSRVVLERDSSMPDGYRIVTTFPIP